MESQKKILLVEDDPNLGFVIKDSLSVKGYDVTLCKDGSEGESVFKERAFNLCILDVMLPKKDGFSLARSIRERNKEIPILFLTAKAMMEDKLTGFQTGADDYIIKPFSLDELICRMEVFLRRTVPAEAVNEKIYHLGGYEFDPHNLVLRKNDSEKTLTQKEAEVLKLLYKNRDRVLKREEILTQIWGNDDYFMGRSMDVFISKLRKYLKDDPAIQIVNYHGVGFRLEVR
ncbi:response regulator transcription factor [Chryseosolibacter indicus]|uniref:Response regulator transcription factor n=1 Tax=Chryseosolibacter indicus TaxID=2782351 RepID=A0ABS5VXP4_9BACT|nr:response regulator transcription factor [Chryseosolibacter indicus]MBT1706031.1 response regulator transcription factor [Chryseosolibacter indicus]